LAILLKRKNIITEFKKNNIKLPIFSPHDNPICLIIESRFKHSLDYLNNPSIDEDSRSLLESNICSWREKCYYYIRNSMHLITPDDLIAIVGCDLSDEEINNSDYSFLGLIFLKKMINIKNIIDRNTKDISYA